MTPERADTLKPMSGLFKRRRKPVDGLAAEPDGAAPHAPPEVPAGLAHEPPPEVPVDGLAGVPPQGDEAPASQELLPAGVDFDALVGRRPTTRRRGRLRRRARHLRKVRELLLRDLGGFVLEVHRAGDEANGRGEQIVGSKLQRLALLDAELRDLEGILGETRRDTIIREPGIGGACEDCGEIHGSDARFCSVCGAAVAPGVMPPLSRFEAAVPLTALPAGGGEHDHASGEEVSGELVAPAPPPTTPAGSWITEEPETPAWPAQEPAPAWNTEPTPGEERS